MEELSFGEVEQLALDLRKFAFAQCKLNISLYGEYSPVFWFLEHYSKGNYMSIFEIWTLGSDLMIGKSLFSRCVELLATHGS
mgnify:CR=1 FL=1